MITVYIIKTLDDTEHSFDNPSTRINIVLKHLKRSTNDNDKITHNRFNNSRKH